MKGEIFMTMDEFMGIMLPVILALITALSTLALYGVRILISQIKAKLKSIEDENDRKYVQEVFAKVEDLIYTAVVETNQTLVENLKKANTDGKLTKEEMLKAFNCTYDRVSSLMSAELTHDFNSVVDNTEDWIASKIEYYVNMNK